jgi:CDP-paratose 2-epimerase
LYKGIGLKFLKEYSNMKILITGGAGFIGCNWASKLMAMGYTVTILDNLSRKGSRLNLEWLRSQGNFDFIEADIRNAKVVSEAVYSQDAVYHLAGQVAVTTSVENPREDFEINAWGTLNVLEAARLSKSNPIVVYASTNKVYGGMEDVNIREDLSRYYYTDLPNGISENQPLDFHSPYGCSKGAGDQYVRDYARIYGLRTVVFRQSCIYGVRQFGVEDQGWLAHFVIATAKKQPITIYGDGKQVRDMLWIDDLLNAYSIALAQPDKIAGRIFNIGGGPKYALSIWTELKPKLEELAEHEISTDFKPWRPGDQKVYISDIRKAAKDLGWEPVVSPEEGIKRIWNWVHANLKLF